MPILHEHEKFTGFNGIFFEQHFDRILYNYITSRKITITNVGRGILQNILAIILKQYVSYN